VTALKQSQDTNAFVIDIGAVDEAVIAMLDSGNRELVFAACGVLINLMVDEEKRPMLLHHNGVAKYVVHLFEFA
jgi:hypothetical protein